MASISAPFKSYSDSVTRESTPMSSKIFNPCSRDKAAEKSQIIEAFSHRINNEKYRFIIPYSWWRKYFNNDHGPIKNKELLLKNSNVDLSPYLHYGVDFYHVNSKLWSLISAYSYDCILARPVIYSNVRKPHVDLYPIMLRGHLWDISLNAPKNHFGEYYCSEFWSIKSFINSISSSRPFRIWLPFIDDRPCLHPVNIENTSWRLISDLSKCASHFDIQRGGTFVIDELQDEGNWSKGDLSETPTFSLKNRYDCMDAYDSWYEVSLSAIKDKKIKVHFVGWGKRFDQWLPFNTNRIAPLHTFTKPSIRKGVSPRGVSADQIFESLENEVPQQFEPVISFSSIHKTSNPQNLNIYCDFSNSFESNSDDSEDESEQPLKIPKIDYCSSKCYMTGTGLVGLINLGNSCFLNSVVQCLVNAPLLAEMFISDEIADQINRDNSLGWNGRVFDEWLSLLRIMWSGEHNIVSPVNLKNVISEFAPRFLGRQQHDASELLSFLLDGLHEDLNRVIVRPKKLQTVRAHKSNGKQRSYISIANESLHNYQLHNQSIISETCVGMLKSKLSCPKCSYCSITFDPFSLISTSLPKHEYFLIKIIRLDWRKPVFTKTILVDIQGTISHLVDQVSKVSNIEKHKILLRKEVDSGFFSTEVLPTQSIHSLLGSILTAFELPSTPFCLLTVFLQDPKIYNYNRNNSIGFQRLIHINSPPSVASILESASFFADKLLPTGYPIFRNGKRIYIHHFLDCQNTYYITATECIGHESVCVNCNRLAWTCNGCKITKKTRHKFTPSSLIEITI